MDSTNSQANLTEQKTPSPIQDTSKTLPITEEELERGAKRQQNKKIGGIKYLILVGGFGLGLFINLILVIINHYLQGTIYLYFPFAIILFVYLITRRKEHGGLFYLAIGMLISTPIFYI